MKKPKITLYNNDPMGKRWQGNLEAASRAEAELGAEIVIVKKTSPDYHPETDPPCPTVAVNGNVLVKDGTVTFEQLRDALLQDREQ